MHHSQRSPQETAITSRLRKHLGANVVFKAAKATLNGSSLELCDMSCVYGNLCWLIFATKTNRLNRALTHNASGARRSLEYLGEVPTFFLNGSHGQVSLSTAGTRFAILSIVEHNSFGVSWTRDETQHIHISVNVQLLYDHFELGLNLCDLVMICHRIPMDTSTSLDIALATVTSYAEDARRNAMRTSAILPTMRAYKEASQFIKARAAAASCVILNAGLDSLADGMHTSKHSWGNDLVIQDRLRAIVNLGFAIDGLDLGQEASLWDFDGLYYSFPILAIRDIWLFRSCYAMQRTHSTLQHPKNRHIPLLYVHENEVPGFALWRLPKETHTEHLLSSLPRRPGT